MVVRNADSCPDTADFVRPFTEDFKYPDFIRVGNCQTFAGIAIAVFFDQFTDQANGIAGSRAALKSDLFQLFDHEHAFLVNQFFPSGNGRFADAQLFFVEARVGGIQKLIGGTGLRDDSF